MAVPEIKIGSKLKLHNKDVYEVNDFYFGCEGDDTNYQAYLNLKNLTTGIHQINPVWMIEQLIRDNDMYLPEREAFVTELLNMRAKREQAVP